MLALGMGLVTVTTCERPTLPFLFTLNKTQCFSVCLEGRHEVLDPVTNSSVLMGATCISNSFIQSFWFGSHDLNVGSWEGVSDLHAHGRQKGSLAQWESDPKSFILGIFILSTIWWKLLVIINSIHMHNKAYVNFLEEQSQQSTDQTRLHQKSL